MNFDHNQGNRFVEGRRTPLGIKLAFSLFAACAFSYYGAAHGPGHLLWFCHVALAGTVLALWLENSLLASMQALAVVLPLGAWTVDFVGRMLTGVPLLGISGYMWSAQTPGLERGISLFHVWLPVLVLWMVWRLGYDRRAWAAQTLLAWSILLACFFLRINVNFALGWGDERNVQQAIRPSLWLAGALIAYPVCVYLPCHLVLSACCERWRGSTTCAADAARPMHRRRRSWSRETPMR